MPLTDTQRSRIDNALAATRREALQFGSLPCDRLELGTELGEDVIAWSLPDDGSSFDTDTAEDLLNRHLVGLLAKPLSGASVTADRATPNNYLRFWFFSGLSDPIDEHTTFQSTKSLAPSPIIPRVFRAGRGRVGLRLGLFVASSVALLGFAALLYIPTHAPDRKVDGLGWVGLIIAFVFLGWHAARNLVLLLPDSEFLRVDREGLTIHTPGRTRVFRWEEVDCFYAMTADNWRHTPVVTFALAQGCAIGQRGGDSLFQPRYNPGSWGVCLPLELDWGMGHDDFAGYLAVLRKRHVSSRPGQQNKCRHCGQSGVELLVSIRLGSNGKVFYTAEDCAECARAWGGDSRVLDESLYLPADRDAGTVHSVSAATAVQAPPGAAPKRPPSGSMNTPKVVLMHGDGRVVDFRAASDTRDGISSRLETGGNQVLDLLSDREKKVVTGATTPIDAESERYTHELCVLLDAFKDQTEEEKYRRGGTIGRIGKELNENGGFERMQLVFYRVKALGGNSSLLEALWDGIGQWWA